ncbi:hypothetical protein HK405_008121 [Cladochytrium tenue]|nr:hypothetical protein HK405_008121 [Cladochytrium tenue]
MQRMIDEISDVDEDEPLSVATAYIRFVLALIKDDQSTAVEQLSLIADSSTDEKEKKFSLSLLLSAADRAFKMGKRNVLLGIFKKIAANSSFLLSEEAVLEDIRALAAPDVQDNLLARQLLCFEYEIAVLRHKAGEHPDGLDLAENVKDILDDAPSTVFQRLADGSIRLRAPSSVVFLTVRAALEAELRQNRQLDLTTYPMEEIQCAGDSEAARMWCDTALQFADFLPPNTPVVQEMRLNFDQIVRNGAGV